MPRDVKPYDTFECVEKLRYEENDPSPNYQTWLDQLTLAVEQKWPDLSRIFTTKGLAYWMPPEVKLPTAEEELADAATGGYRRYMTKYLLTARQARIDKMEIDKIPCFAFIMSTVSEESREGVAKLDNYEAEIKNSRDPSLLLKAFELTHSTNFSPNATLMALNVENQYAALKQHSNESLLLYKRRIEFTLRMYDAIRLVRPPHATVVNNMMKTVNQAKYRHSIESLMTAVRENVKPFPATTQELYVYLVGRVSDSAHQRQDHTSDSVLFTTNESKHAAIDRSTSLPSRDCYICPKHVPPADRRHWQSECPYLDQFHRLIEKEDIITKGTKVKKQTAFAIADHADDCCDRGSDHMDFAWLTLTSDTVSGSNGPIRGGDVILDCAATVSIVNNSGLLKNIRPLAIPRVVCGVGGAVTIELCGELPVVGTVLYSASFPMSVLSQSSITKHGLEVSYDQSLDRYTIGDPVIGALLTFLPQCGLYVCDMMHSEDGGTPHRDTVHDTPTLVAHVEEGSVNTRLQHPPVWSHDRTTNQKAHMRNGSFKLTLWTILQLIIVHWIIHITSCIDKIQSPQCSITQAPVCIKNSTVNKSIQGIQVSPQTEPKTGVDILNEDHVVVELASVLKTMHVRADTFPASIECLLSDNNPDRIPVEKLPAYTESYETREGYPSRSSRMKLARSYSIGKALDIDCKKSPHRLCTMTGQIPGPSQHSPPDHKKHIKDLLSEATMSSTMSVLVTASGKALADTAYGYEDDMHGTKTNAMQSFAYMELGELLSSGSWTLEYLRTWTIPDVKPNDWNERSNADPEGCSFDLPHNTVTDVIAFKRANIVCRMHAMLDPYRKRVPLRLVEGDRGALGSQSIEDSRWLSERALGCSCGSDINLFRISCITKVDKFLTDTMDAQWTYSLDTEDLLQSSYGATDNTRTFYRGPSITRATATDITMTLAAIRHLFPQQDKAEQWTSLKFRFRAVIISMTCSNQLLSPAVLRCQHLLHVHSNLLNLLWNNEAIGLFHAHPMYAKQAGTSYLQYK